MYRHKSRIHFDQVIGYLIAVVFMVAVFYMIYLRTEYGQSCQGVVVVDDVGIPRCVPMEQVGVLTGGRRYR